MFHIIKPQPAISSKLRIGDTCGVHNLHGMPALLSALFSAVYAAIATEDNYKSSLTTIFPAMEKDMNSTMHEVHIIGVCILVSSSSKPYE